MGKLLGKGEEACGKQQRSDRGQSQLAAGLLGAAIGMVGAAAATHLRRLLFRSKRRTAHSMKCECRAEVREIPVGAHPTLLARVVEENMQLRDALSSIILNDMREALADADRRKDAVLAAEAELQELRRSNQLLAAQVDQLEENLWVLKMEETSQVGALRRELEEVVRWAEYMEQEYSALEAELEALRGEGEGSWDEHSEGEATISEHLAFSQPSSPTSYDDPESTGQSGACSVLGYPQRRLSNSPWTRESFVDRQRDPEDGGVAIEEASRAASTPHNTKRVEGRAAHNGLPSASRCNKKQPAPSLGECRPGCRNNRCLG